MREIVSMLEQAGQTTLCLGQRHSLIKAPKPTEQHSGKETQGDVLMVEINTMMMMEG